MSSSTEVTAPQPTIPSYIFTPTQDWFSGNIPAWTLLFPLVTSPAPRVLEIGTWEGRSSVFLLTKLCANGGELVCIDHFDLMRTEAGRARHIRVLHNLGETGKPFRVLDDFSVPALMTLLKDEMSSDSPGFDWIYVDGSHEADDTFLDGELAWRLARKGAIIIFDDYHWGREPEDSIHHPRRGVDAFMTLHRGDYERLSSETQYQMVLRKTSNMRIGFLTKELGEIRDEALDEALAYGINIAFTINAEYAMPAAVAMRSAVEQTQGRISFYVVDCGLTDQDKETLGASIPERPDVTLTYLSLPENGVAAQPDMDIVWAKIDMMEILPVERVLYLDADVLIRSDLKALWDIDLRGQLVGCAVDVGMPFGHTGPGMTGYRAPYFNAGVMLIDLAAVRHTLSELKTLAQEMIGASFKDQDALNVHFKDKWMHLTLKWNAQGLGTYASMPSADRDTLRLDDMQDPGIVHYTGPVHPSMADVLNPYVQPFTAKPWGYAGAPGHPFAKEWWHTLERTMWKSWSADVAMGKERAIQAGVEEFQRRLNTSQSEI